jgi:hypothetical protein
MLGCREGRGVGCVGWLLWSKSGERKRVSDQSRLYEDHWLLGHHRQQHRRSDEPYCAGEGLTEGVIDPRPSQTFNSGCGDVCVSVQSAETE